MNKAIIFDIIRNSYVDGPGVRTTVFFKGCNLNCEWCHNPESKSPKLQMMFYKQNCSGCGKCLKVCKNELKTCDFCGKCTLLCPNSARKICGKEYTTDEILKEVFKDKTYYENSGGGVTFSGGECMLQIDFLLETLKKCKENGINTAVDTAGNVPFSAFEKIIPFTDLFLYDIKSTDTQVHKKYTAVGNELILENLSRLLVSGKEIWVRIPIIPTVNDSVEEMLKIRSFFEKYGFPQKTELLPYHKMGENKYSALGQSVKTFSVPDKEKMEELKNIFKI